MTLQRWGTNPSARLWRAPPLSGEALRGRRQGVAAKPPQSTVSCLSGTTKGRSPSGGFAIALWKPSPPAYRLVSYPTSEGRGGSVSRRDHNQVAGNRTHLSGGTNYAEATPPNASRSSEEGVWGGGASLREAASSPAFPLTPSSVEEGARGRGLFCRKVPSLAYFISISLLTFVRNQTTLIKSDFGLGGMK